MFLHLCVILFTGGGGAGHGDTCWEATFHMTRGICLQGNLPSGGVYIRREGGLPSSGVCIWGVCIQTHLDPGCRPTCQRHRYPHILPGLDLDTWESQVVNPGFVGDANIWFHQIFWKIAWNTFWCARGVRYLICLYKLCCQVFLRAHLWCVFKIISDTIEVRFFIANRISA